MSNIAVDVQGVSKRFRLHHEKYTSLKERAIHLHKKGYEDFWALRDISLEVKEGDTIGILGRNGSGKSTLLKCICGVLQPTKGQVVVRGKLSGLLELGAGFQQDLTGRENIYLNGSLLGLSKREVDRVFDEIVTFAGLDEFIDNQVKFYSSGMYVRLGFAVAVNVEPDILVIDEVLAVGDERFQRKCIDKIKQFQEEGRTIILVTHSPDQVRAICDRALVLSSGVSIGERQPGEAVRIFRENLMEADENLSIREASDTATTQVGNEGQDGHAGSESDSISIKTALKDQPKVFDENRPVRIKNALHTFPGAETNPYMHTGDPLTVGIHFEAFLPTKSVVFVLELRDDNGNTLMRTDTDILGVNIDLPKGIGGINFIVQNIPLLDGTFEYAVGIQGGGGSLYDWRDAAGHFEVLYTGRTTGLLELPVTAALIPDDLLEIIPDPISETPSSARDSSFDLDVSDGSTLQDHDPKESSAQPHGYSSV